MKRYVRSAKKFAISQGRAKLEYFGRSVYDNERKKRELKEMIYRCGTRENAPKKAQPSEGSFDEVEPKGYASSRAGFSTWLVNSD